MKSGKFEDIQDRIDSLPNWQVFLCCRTMVVLLDKQLASQTGSLRPNDLIITDFGQFAQSADAGIQSWCRSLEAARRPVLASLGRFLMTMCLNYGYTQTVISACATAQAPVAHLGDLQPAQIVSALGVVMAWMPNGQQMPLPQPELFSRMDDACGWPTRNAETTQPCKPVVQ